MDSVKRKAQMERQEQPEEREEAGAYSCVDDEMRPEDVETAKLLRIFPKELWVQILDGITDPRTLSSLATHFDLFNEILEPRKTTFLFPDVWRVLDSYFHQTAPADLKAISDSEQSEDLNPAAIVEQPLQQNDNDIIAIEDEAADHVIQEIDENEDENEDEGLSECNDCFRWVKNWWITKSMDLRLVCGTWKSGIDNAHQEQISPTFWEPSPTRYVCNLRGRGLELHQEDNDTIAEFLTHFRETHQHTDIPPIITRHVSLKMSSSDEFTEELIAFLETYGPRFWSCELCISNEGNVDNLCVNLNTVLSNMRNLKQLFVYGNTQNPLYVDAGTKMTHFPCLPTLEYLVFHELPDALTTGLTLANPHVQHLSLANHQPISDQFVNALIMLNPKTVDLQVRSFHDVTKLRFASRSWKVRSAYVLVCTNSGRSPAFVRYVDVFRLVENWRETLTVAAIKLGKARCEDQRLSVVMDTSLHALTLPKVEYLYCELSNMCSFDFILGTATSLKSLIVTMHCTDNSEAPLARRWEEIPGKVIDLNPTDQDQDVYQSNLWDNLPALETFDFGVFQPSQNQADTEYLYTRNEYQRKNRNF